MTMQLETKLRIPEWSFGDRVRKARLEMGMDQKEFAAAIDITASTLAAYETGRANPRFKDAVPLAKRLEALTQIHRGWFLGSQGQPSDYKAIVSDIRHHRQMTTRPTNRSRVNTHPGSLQKAG